MGGHNIAHHAQQHRPHDQVKRDDEGPFEINNSNTTMNKTPGRPNGIVQAMQDARPTSLLPN
jgi:hypothetical protein